MLLLCVALLLDVLRCVLALVCVLVVSMLCADIALDVLALRAIVWMLSDLMSDM